MRPAAVYKSSPSPRPSFSPHTYLAGLWDAHKCPRGLGHGSGSSEPKDVDPSRVPRTIFAFALRGPFSLSPLAVADGLKKKTFVLALGYFGLGCVVSSWLLRILYSVVLRIHPVAVTVAGTALSFCGLERWTRWMGWSAILHALSLLKLRLRRKTSENSPISL